MIIGCHDLDRRTMPVTRLELNSGRSRRPGPGLITQTRAGVPSLYHNATSSTWMPVSCPSWQLDTVGHQFEPGYWWRPCQWCDLGCCFRTVVVINLKLRRTSAFPNDSSLRFGLMMISGGDAGSPIRRLPHVCQCHRHCDAAAKTGKTLAIFCFSCLESIVQLKEDELGFVMLGETSQQCKPLASADVS